MAAQKPPSLTPRWVKIQPTKWVSFTPSLTRVAAEQPARLPAPKENEPMAVTAESVTIASEEEYEALPSGAVFIDPEGQERQKP
jgi:hypothetical protein